jgi:drug/metabolite transporter (DMT)-like permease
MTEPRRRTTATETEARLAAFGAIVLWGISFVATKAALRELDPAPLVFARFGMGAVLIVGLLAARGELKRTPAGAWRDLVLLGFLGVFVHQMLQAHGLQHTSAVTTGWLIGLIPIWAAILAAIFLGETLTPLRIAGLVLGFAGAVLVITRGRLSSEFMALPSTRGDLLILASTLNWAVVTVLQRRPSERLGARLATAGTMVVGFLLLAPVFFASGGFGAFASLSPATWLAVVFLGLGCSGLGYLWWYGALERLEASQVAAFLYLEPLVTLAAAMLLLGEPVGWATIVGGLVVLAGVALVQKRPKSASN